MIKEQLAQQVVWGVDGGAFGPRSATVLTTGQIFTIPQGFWLVESPAVASVTIVFTPDAGTTTVAYPAAASTSAKTYVFSDGFSWFLSNATGTNTVNLTQIKTLF
jgi:hypothetical protein